MIQANYDEFVSLLSSLATAFGVKANESLFSGYWMGLDDIGIERVRHAIKASMRSCKFMPKPIELRELCGEVSSNERAVLAWQAVKDSIAMHGCYRSVDFDDKLINATIRNLGGWVSLCQKDVDEFEKWTRKDFERVYTSLLNSGATKEACEYLVGIAEKNNFGKGYDLEKVVHVQTGLPEHKNFRLINGGKSENQNGVNLLAESLSEKMEIK